MTGSQGTPRAGSESEESQLDEGGSRALHRTYTVADETPDLKDLPPFMTADELAVLLSVKRRTVYQWADAGLIPARRVGRRLIRFTPADVAELLRRSEMET